MRLLCFVDRDLNDRFILLRSVSLKQRSIVSDKRLQAPVRTDIMAGAPRVGVGVLLWRGEFVLVGRRCTLPFSEGLCKSCSLYKWCLSLSVPTRYDSVHAITYLATGQQDLFMALSKSCRELGIKGPLQSA